jgi:hypothetical protein
MVAASIAHSWLRACCVCAVCAVCLCRVCAVCVCVCCVCAVCVLCVRAVCVLCGALPTCMVLRMWAPLRSVTCVAPRCARYLCDAVGKSPPTCITELHQLLASTTTMD